jgi:hypothetical protein
MIAKHVKSDDRPTFPVPLDECIAAYSELMKAVFKEESSWLPVSWSGKLKARFDSVKLRSAVNDVVPVASSDASLTNTFDDGKV